MEPVLDASASPTLDMSFEEGGDTQLFPEAMEVRAWLEAEDGRRWTLQVPETTIGRTSDNHIQLSHPSVSKHHARILYHQGRFWLEDLNSTNGTRVGRRRLRGERVPLEDGALVQFGVMAPMRFRIQSHHG